MRKHARSHSVVIGNTKGEILCLTDGLKASEKKRLK